MKRITAILLALIMIFMCGCGGGTNEKDPYEAVKPVEGEQLEPIKDSTWGADFPLTHIDTESRGEDAKVILDIISEYLKSQGMTADIKALYSIAFGIAGNFDDIPVVKVVFTDESVLPVYIPILHDFRQYSKGYSVMGSFRDSDVVGGEYFNKALSVIDNYDSKLKSDIGLLRDDITVNFSPRIIRDLSFKTAGEEDKKLFDDTQNVYSKFTLAMWYDVMEENLTKIGDIYYQKITDPKFNSLASLDVFLGTAFTQREVTEIKDANSEMFEGNYPIYVEKDGALYVAGIGMGGNAYIEDVALKYVAENDNYYFMIIEVKRCERDDNFEPINPYYTEHLWVFEKQNGGTYRCDYYDDYIFGRFLSMMPTV